MNRDTSAWVCLVSCSLLLVQCGDTEDGSSGNEPTSGAPSDGGVPGEEGGSPSSGGAPRTGGAPSTGGTTSNGGVPATGGAQAATGGDEPGGAAGAISSGGSAGSSESGGTAGADPVEGGTGSGGSSGGATYQASQVCLNCLTMNQQMTYFAACVYDVPCSACLSGADCSTVSQDTTAMWTRTCNYMRNTCATACIDDASPPPVCPD
jgi:hypothetical protein